METLIAKLKSWIPSNIAGLLGILQAVVKFGKEVSTLFIDLICPLIPGDSDKALVEKVRAVFNAIDAFIEKAKEWLLKI